MSTNSSQKKLTRKQLTIRITAWILSILMVGSTAAAVITSLVEH